MKGRCRNVFNGRLLRVFQEKKKLPNGRLAYLEKINHPGAALIVPFDGEKVVFIRQFRAVLDKYIWELPAGTLNRGETPRACAEREITEETGYKVKGLKRVGFIYPTPGYSNEKIHIFRAECAGKEAPFKDSDELISVRLFTKKDILRLFKSGKIIDSKTISALALAGIL